MKNNHGSWVYTMVNSVEIRDIFTELISGCIPSWAMWSVGTDVLHRVKGADGSFWKLSSALIGVMHSKVMTLESC